MLLNNVIVNVVVISKISYQTYPVINGKFVPYPVSLPGQSSGSGCPCLVSCITL